MPMPPTRHIVEAAGAPVRPAYQLSAALANDSQIGQGPQGRSASVCPPWNEGGFMCPTFMFEPV
jgi:hypothetical protein